MRCAPGNVAAERAAQPVLERHDQQRAEHRAEIVPMPPISAISANLTPTSGSVNSVGGSSDAHIHREQAAADAGERGAQRHALRASRSSTLMPAARAASSLSRTASRVVAEAAAAHDDDDDQHHDRRGSRTSAARIAIVAENHVREAGAERDRRARAGRRSARRNSWRATKATSLNAIVAMAKNGPRSRKVGQEISSRDDGRERRGGEEREPRGDAGSR